MVHPQLVRLDRPQAVTLHVPHTERSRQLKASYRLPRTVENPPPDYVGCLLLSLQPDGAVGAQDDLGDGRLKAGHVFTNDPAGLAKRKATALDAGAASIHEVVDVLLGKR